MANTVSAKKMTRKIAKRTAVNRSRRSRMRTFLRKVEEAISGGDQSVALRGLSNGDHTLHVRTSDAAGNDADDELRFSVDTVIPTVTMNSPSEPFQLSLTGLVSWAGQDKGSGIEGYTVRVQRSTPTSSFGDWSSTSVSSASTSRTFQPLLPGSTYCYSVMAHDFADNNSEWALSRCTAVPLDDRSLKRSSGWTPSTPSGWFQGTAVSTSKKGKKLSVDASVSRIAMVAQTCPKCGKVGIYVGSAKVGTMNLRSSAKTVRMISLPTFSLRSGTVTLKVLTKNKLVRIDALGLSRV